LFRWAVVSNASVWDTLKLLPEASISKHDRQQRQQTPECESFMHLHLGIDATGLRSDLACHYIVVNDWNLGVTAPQNVVVVSIPSVLDPSLASAGKHVIHVYTPGNKPYQFWQGLSRSSETYQALKDERSQVMWQALERDSTFPGIGLPAVAASGMITANTLASVPQHVELLKRIGYY
jgi:phytoene dehydrogenase-like protein